MDLDEGALKLIDPENLTVLNTQPIHTIRVWGVGRDNGRFVNYYLLILCMDCFIKNLLFSFSMLRLQGKVMFTILLVLNKQPYFV